MGFNRGKSARIALKTPGIDSLQNFTSILISKKKSNSHFFDEKNNFENRKNKILKFFKFHNTKIFFLWKNIFSFFIGKLYFPLQNLKICFWKFKFWEKCFFSFQKKIIEQIFLIKKLDIEIAVNFYRESIFRIHELIWFL